MIVIDLKILLAKYLINTHMLTVDVDDVKVDANESTKVARKIHERCTKKNVKNKSGTSVQNKKKNNRKNGTRSVPARRIQKVYQRCTRYVYKKTGLRQSMHDQR